MGDGQIKKWLIVISVLIVVFFVINTIPKASAAISLLKYFGGKVVAITPNLDPFCPAGTNIITVGPPKPIVAIFTNTPLTVKNGPTKIGSWVVGIASRAVPPCLSVVVLMGTSK